MRRERKHPAPEPYALLRYAGLLLLALALIVTPFLLLGAVAASRFS
jgi:hypothetical protein